MSENLNTREVILLHGLGRTPASMMPIGWRLTRAGFQVRRLGYPSTQSRISGSMSHVAQMIQAMGRPAHIVGHSLGGLIGAMLLREGRLPIGRVVQLGSPNLGSPAADSLGGAWAIRKICGPAVGELAMHDRAKPAHGRIAAIAGIGGPALPGIELRGPHDGVVSQASAWAGAGHTATVRSLHSFLPASAQAADLTAHFLTDGQFPETPA